MSEPIDYLEAAKEQLTKADHRTIEAELYPENAAINATLAKYHEEQAHTLALVAIADELRKLNVNLGVLAS